ncbi:MAG: response regulator, partial [Bacteroidota bacterium]|nr:response regulator [Bacteroidota bacterium]
MEAKSTKHVTILWADDDPDDRHIICDIVEGMSSHYRVKEVQNGRQVLDYLHAAAQSSELPCLVVLDINMPVLNGTDTLAILKSDDTFKDLTVAVFTTSSSERDRLMCRRFGVPMLTKPQLFSEFQKVVSQILQLCSQDT